MALIGLRDRRSDRPRICNGCVADMMRLMGWPGTERIGQPRADRSAGRCAGLRGALALILLSGGLSACDPTQSFERTGDGSTVYIDQLSEAAKEEARQKIVQSLTRGIAVYDVGVGDELEIFFHVARKPTPGQYVISPTDELRIEFLGGTDNDRTVEVPPDGRISLPLIGPVMAAGQTVDALARQLQERYSHVLTEPKITVNLTKTHSALDNFTGLLGASTKGRSLLAKVLPDGTLSLPRLPPLAAGGRALPELQREIDAAYAASGLAVSVSLVPRTLRTGATLVIGEVRKPGRLQLDRPTTVLMAVAQAGGVLRTGSMSVVRLFYVGEDGARRVRSINLSEVLDDLRLEDDMIVPPNSIIYVPPTSLAATGRFLDSVLRDILRYQGFAIGGGFSL
jgi:protein involved in polysaccharide export with SLBB domain